MNEFLSLKTKIEHKGCTFACMCVCVSVNEPLNSLFSLFLEHLLTFASAFTPECIFSLLTAAARHSQQNSCVSGFPVGAKENLNSITSEKMAAPGAHPRLPSILKTTSMNYGTVSVPVFHTSIRAHTSTQTFTLSSHKSPPAHQYL